MEFRVTKFPSYPDYLGVRLGEDNRQLLADAVTISNGPSQSQIAREAIREYAQRIIAEGGAEHPREAPTNERELPARPKLRAARRC